ncbi:MULTISPECIES: tRNA-uridine aminocarboxypropyltransferase [Pseudomonas]|uniref:tRNA-uridine aminocarboxypropyltransferase n=1 Tax=Pseudomonas TaxID=286 RepID=UPI00123BC1C6|nr:MULTISPECIES: DTW domain-containing protein [Pseudomonas]QIB51583.1 DTW domain-containing protein [Pseudomonas sp. OIL-1]
MTRSESDRRPWCRACERPASHCLCSLIPDLDSNTHLLVIQHPSEQRHPLNTARLLVRGLKNARLLIAEQLSGQSDWYQQLQDPAWRTELLFPGAESALLLAASADTRPHRLVLLDGTWRKARKILHVNPVLQHLPRVALPVGLHSRYRVRKAPMEGALSTVEAAVAALNIIEPDTDFSALLTPFEALIDGQIKAMGEERFHRNYRPS